MWIRIQLLINVMRICNYWSTIHPWLHFKLQFFIVSVHGPSCLHFEPLLFLNFDFDADSDAALHADTDSDPDPDPALQTMEDPDPRPFI
jgi:hypothetical protein